MKKVIFVGMLILFLGALLAIGSHYFTAKQSLLPHQLEYRGCEITQEIGLLSLEQHHGNGGILQFSDGNENIRLIWSSICLSAKERENFIYLRGKYSQNYLYIYRFYNDANQRTLWVKPGILYKLTSKIIELRPGEIATLTIETNLPPSTDADLELLEIFQKFKIVFQAYYWRPTGFPATSSNLIVPSK